MPLLYYHSARHAEVALWRATEPTFVYREKLEEHHFPTVADSRISHPEKLRQWYASRYLLCEIYPAAIQLYRERKPYLFNGPKVSFTHSGDVVGVMLSQFPSGMDVQYPNAKLAVIADKFLHASDLKQVNSGNHLQDLCIIWCVKEAIFKTYGTGLAFRDIELTAYDASAGRASALAHRKGASEAHEVAIRKIDQLVLAYVLFPEGEGLHLRRLKATEE